MTTRHICLSEVILGRFATMLKIIWVQLDSGHLGNSACDTSAAVALIIWSRGVFSHFINVLHNEWFSLWGFKRIWKKRVSYVQGGALKIFHQVCLMVSRAQRLTVVWYNGNEIDQSARGTDPGRGRGSNNTNWSLDCDKFDKCSNGKWNKLHFM